MSQSFNQSLPRFSSQVLSNLGAQQINVGGNQPIYKYSNGYQYTAPVDSVIMSTIGQGVVGSITSDDYNTTTAFFLDRGASKPYADAMTLVMVDIAAITGASVGQVLESSVLTGKVQLTDDAYRAMNLVRSQTNQITQLTPVSNKDSLQSRQILA